jgi:hypothetical protein
MEVTCSSETSVDFSTDCTALYSGRQADFSSDRNACLFAYVSLVSSSEQSDTVSCDVIASVGSRLVLTSQPGMHFKLDGAHSKDRGHMCGAPLSMNTTSRMRPITEHINWM